VLSLQNVIGEPAGEGGRHLGKKKSRQGGAPGRKARGGLTDGVATSRDVLVSRGHGGEVDTDSPLCQKRV